MFTTKQLVIFALVACLALCQYTTRVQAVVDESIYDVNVYLQWLPIVTDQFRHIGVPFLQHYVLMIVQGSYEAISLYDNTAVGMYVDTNQLRRPVSERTVRNKNKAIAQQLYRTYLDFFPGSKQLLDDALVNVFGLDPNNQSRDLSTPVGVGNYVADVVLARFRRDGANKLGDMERSKDGEIIFREFNRLNYSDYSGYQPLNSAFELKDVDRWQPLIHKVGDYTPFEIQVFKGAHFGEMNTTSGLTPEDLGVPPQKDTWRHNKKAYKQKVDEVLAASAALTESQKLMSEWHDDKIRGLSETLAYSFDAWNVDRFVRLQVIANNALMDAFILLWKLKAQYDAVRPITAIKFLYGNKKVRAWAGPGMGVQYIYGREWSSYLKNDAFPEYPSGTTCLCAVAGRVIKRFYANNNRQWTMSKTFPAGSSVVEPGISPVNDLTLTWNTIDDWVNESGRSRQWGGVHFTQAIDVSLDVCPQIADKVYSKLEPLMGTI